MQAKMELKEKSETMKPHAEHSVTKVEDILKNLGGFSRYQKWLMMILTFPQFPTSQIILSAIFTGSNNVPLHCTEELASDATCNASCVNMTTKLTYTSIVQEWNLCGSGEAWKVDIITSALMAGMTTGAISSSIISDQFGRKTCFLLQTICMGVLGMLSAAAFNPWSYAVTRFLAACFVVYLSHLMEFLTPDWRTICGTISLWPIGEMSLGLLAYLIGDWRYLTVATAAPALFILIFHSLVLESPRWLLVRKRTEEAHEVFTKIAKWNGKPPPTLKSVELLQEEILKEESSTIHGIKAVKMIFENRRLRIHMAILTFCNLTCAIVYYGVSFNAKNLSGSPYWNIFYMGIFDLFGCPAAIPFNNWIGRRKTFMLYMVIGFVFIFSLVVLQFLGGLSAYPAIVVTVLSLSARFGIVAAWGALTCLVLETAPTNLRSTCLGFTAFVGYLGGVLAPQLFLLASVTPSLPYVVLCILTSVCSVSSWFIRETLQRPLEDVVESDKK